jgi:hypothetical protein
MGRDDEDNPREFYRGVGRDDEDFTREFWRVGDRRWMGNWQWMGQYGN